MSTRRETKGAAPVSGALEVPGAKLSYEVRGAGPVLLLIHGGNGDTDLFGRLADELTDRYTVVAHVRRGFPRSPLSGPVDGRGRFEADRDDALRLLDRLADGPAYVFGSSSGALVAVDLIAQYPERVRVLVAHEPPAVTLLQDAARHLGFAEEVYETYLRAGVGPAMRKIGRRRTASIARSPKGTNRPRGRREPTATSNSGSNTSSDSTPASFRTSPR